MDILDQKVERVEIDKIFPYPKNPRKGNVALIMESLKESGQFRPLIVQKSTGYILGGNHTYLACVELGWATVLVVYVDVDDERAKRIVLADNRTSDMATYDAQILSEILSTLDRPSVGTGYTTSELKGLMDAVEESNEELIRDIVAPVQEISLDGGGDMGPGPAESLGTMDQMLSDNPPEDDWEEPSIEKQPDLLDGILQLGDDMKFDSEGYWGIPPLRTDMLMTEAELPKNLLAWSGSATKNWPDKDQWWIYNYGIDSTSGMHDTSKCILAFYTHDHYFEDWAARPGAFTTKMINSGMEYAVTPDYSLYSEIMTRAEMLYNVFRQRYVGRYMQEAGIKIIPNIAYPYDDIQFQRDICFASLPKNIPVAMSEFQSVGKDVTKAQRAMLVQQAELVLTELNIGTWIWYVGREGEQLAQQINRNLSKTKIITIQNRMRKLSKKAQSKANSDKI